jgi:2-dehydropantoate 2-reductase
MRWVIVGAGAVGGAIAGRLSGAGEDVVAVARGAHADAIEAAGLRLVEPDRDRTFRLPLVRPGELELAGGDLVVLAVKSQDSAGALAALRGRAPVVCAQNGVANEAAVLAAGFEAVGMMVWMPGQHLEPGVVELMTVPPGYLRLGAWPSGDSQLAGELAGRLAGAGFDCEAVADIARWKYGKLLTNLGNALDAFCEPGGRRALFSEVRAEGERVLAAAGIDYLPPDDLIARAMAVVPARSPGARDRGGGSTWQSLARGASLEVPYLNGQIVQLADSCGVPAPLNRALTELSPEFESGARAARSLAADELQRRALHGREP